MSINIKNPHVCELIDLAAERTGQSKTSVIETALTELLAELDRREKRDDAKRRKEQDAALNAIRKHLTDMGPGARERIDNELYDENGLFR